MNWEKEYEAMGNGPKRPPTDEELEEFLGIFIDRWTDSLIEKYGPDRAMKIVTAYDEKGITKLFYAWINQSRETMDYLTRTRISFG